MALLPAKLWYFASAGAQACYYAFLPVVYTRLGLSPAQVGVLLGVAPLVTAAAMPLWTALADSTQSHRAVLLGTAAASTFLHCLLPLCPPRMTILLPLVVVAEAVFSPAVPLADAAVGLTLQRAGLSFAEYGKQRLWGAVGWGFVFAPLVGAIETYGRGTVRAAAPYVGHVLCCLVSLCAARLLTQPGDALVAQPAAGSCEEDVELLADAPAEPADADSLKSVPACTLTSFGKENDAAEATLVSRIAHAVRSTPGAQLRLALFVVIGASMGAIDTFLFVELTELGASTLLMGIALSVTCVAEVAVFFFAGRIQARIGVNGCLYVILCSYIVRMLYYAALRLMGSPWAVLPAQLLHGITFGLHWQIGNAYMRDLAPLGLESTLQGLFQALNAGGMFVGNLVGGVLAQRLGCGNMFACFAAAVAIVHCAFFVSCQRESVREALQERSNDRMVN